MTIYGLMMVRNEVDLLRANLAFHLAAGVDAFLVVDNGSTDGTTQLLERLGRDPRVAWTRWEGSYRQSEITTALAREAYLRGADWVLPIDADEFWWTAGGNLRAVLRDVDGGAVAVRVVNFVQRREQAETDSEALLHMTRRAPSTSGDWEGDKARVARGEIAFVEATYPPKWICRATPLLEISMGNHEVMGESGAKIETDAIVCLHAPLRSRAALRAKIVDHGVRANELGLAGDLWWQAKRWSGLDLAGGLAAEWGASSYSGDALEVEGTAHPLIEDCRLRQAVAPWLDDAAPWAASKATPAIVHPPFRLAESEGRLVVEPVVKAADEPAATWTIRLDRCARAIDHLRALVDERERHIEARLRDIEYLRAELAQREEGIDYLRAELAQRTDGVDYLRGELASRQQSLESLRAELARRDAAIAEAGDRETRWKESVAALAREMESLRASTSWKITAPLRALGRREKRS